MNSRERVRMALSHGKPDRVPAAFEAVEAVNQKLLAHYGYTDMAQLYVRYEIDIVPTGPRYVGPPCPQWTDDQGVRMRKDYWGATYRLVHTDVDTYWDQVAYPLQGVDSMEKLDAYTFPKTEWFDYSAIGEIRRRYPDKALIIGHEGPFQHMCALMKMDELMMLMYDEPELVQEMFRRLVDFELRHYQRCFDAAPGEVDILRTHDDYGTQISLLFCTEMWQEFFQENTRRLVELAHRNGAFFQQHSCGAVEPIIPMLIDCGVDSLEPVQKVQGMEAERLMEKYGDRMAFHGGVDTQHVLLHGSVEGVKAETRRLIRTFGEHGGYILMASQGFEGDVPLENIEAVYSVSRKPEEE